MKGSAVSYTCKTHTQLHELCFRSPLFGCVKYNFCSTVQLYRIWYYLYQPLPGCFEIWSFCSHSSIPFSMQVVAENWINVKIDFLFSCKTCKDAAPDDRTFVIEGELCSCDELSSEPNGFHLHQKTSRLHWHWVKLSFSSTPSPESDSKTASE